MSHEAVFIPAQPFTVVNASQLSNAPASYASLDPVGLTWRSAGVSGAYVTLQTAAGFDGISLARTNLTAGAQVRVRVASSSDMSNAIVDRTVSAWSGLAGLEGAYTTILLETPVNGPYVRIDINDPTNTASYLETQRIVVGRRVQCDGVDYGAEQGFEDDSTIDSSGGITTVDHYRVRPSWKFTVSDATDLTYARDWVPFMYQMGKTRSFMFIPDLDSPYVQRQATLARISSTAKGSSPGSDFWKLDLQILAV